MFPLQLAHLPSFHHMAIATINITVIALVALVHKYSKATDQRGRIFIAMGLFMLTWVDFAYLARLVGQSSLAISEVFLRLAWVATPLFFYYTYLVSVTVIFQAVRKSTLNTTLLVIAVALSAASAFSNLIIEGIKFTGTNIDIQYGVGFYPFLAIISLFMVLTLVPVFRTKMTSKSWAFLAGVLIFYVANIIFNISLPAFMHVTHLYYLGDYSTVFLLALTAYAIIEHELFKVRVIATQALTIVLWIILFVRLFGTTSLTEFVVDLFVFATSVAFGVLFLKSVREERVQKQKLEELAVRLQDMDKQKDEFISVAAHELRAPMTAIKGYLSMIAEGDAGAIPEEAVQYLGDAIIGNDRLIRLVNNMLNVARIEEGRLVYQIGNVRLSEVVRRVFDEFRLEAQDKGLAMKIEIPDPINDLVRADEDRVHEVVANFVSNGIKYTDKGSVVIKLVQPTPQSIRCEIVDTGPGISKEDGEKLFNKFYRSESAIGKAVGSGLGLYISKLLIEEFKGKIGFTSTPGKGSNFWFELPLVSQEAQSQ